MPKIFIYGSYAKGNFQTESDIDICIIARNIKNNFKATLTASSTSALIDPRLEPIVIAEDEFESGDFGIIREIKNTGVMV